MLKDKDQNKKKTCRDCNKEYKNDREIVMYKTQGCPVFWRLCDACMKKRWLNFWDGAYENDNDREKINTGTGEDREQTT